MQDIKVIFDPYGTDLWDNQVFNYEIALTADALALYLLAENLRKLGYKVMTADVFLKSGDFVGYNLLITEAETKYTRLLLSHGCIPAICYCGESPLVIPQYYNNLLTKAGIFKHSYLFRGANTSFLSENNTKHTFYWTNAKNSINTDIPWERRKFLTLINSNKYSTKPISVKKISDIKTWIKIVLKYILNWKSFQTFPGNIPDLYKIRIKALLHFCRNDKLDLYGLGWNKNIIGVSETEQQMIRNAYRGELPRGNANKHEILKNYQYGLCFENTIFPGYVTEKIFDCILCGTIPVYLGAPDINEYVPQNVFIDFNKFQSFKELDYYLSNLSIVESEKYRIAAYDFVYSQTFEKFCLTGWINDIMLSIKDVIHGSLNKMKE